MSSRALVAAASVIGVVLVLAVGLSRGTVDGAPCPERVWASALDGLAERDPDRCEAQALDRLYAVAAGLMGLVLISGLLARRD